MSSGILLVDKPVGFSSFRVVRIFQKRYKKVGHGGTLDPFANGLLVIFIGEQTKKFLSIQTLDKEYIGEAFLGVSTTTHDLSGEHILRSEIGLEENVNSTKLSLQKLNELTKVFTGEIEQKPPVFSAIKQNGKRLYQLSRKGIAVIPKSRKVFIKEFTITTVQYPLIRFKTVVGKGVYIRSLVHDFGERIGCGAHLISLRRVRIGQYEVAHAWKLGDILDPSQMEKSHRVISTLEQVR